MVSSHPLASVSGLAIVCLFLEADAMTKPYGRRLRGIEREFFIRRHVTRYRVSAERQIQNASVR